MTPLERYRKHYLMFDYWNQDLLDSLQARSPNPKRYRRSSEEALSELKTLQSLLNDEAAGRLTTHIDERVKIDHQAQTQEFRDMAQVGLLVRRVELQTREIHRSFFWRDVQDELKPIPVIAPRPSAVGGMVEQEQVGGRDVAPIGAELQVPQALPMGLHQPPQAKPSETDAAVH